VQLRQLFADEARQRTPIRARQLDQRVDPALSRAPRWLTQATVPPCGLLGVWGGGAPAMSGGR
jgi:hypothetical protein